MTTKDFRFVAGARSLDLLSTRGGAYGPDPVERLASPERLAEWLGLVGLEPKAAPNEGDLDAAIELREALWPVVHATIDGKRPPAGALRTVNAHLRSADAKLEASPARGGGVTLTPPATPRAALGRLAREVLEILSGPHAGELHTCEGGDCRMVFIDPTGRRRWCSTAVCGNRERVRRFRERQRG